MISFQRPIIETETVCDENGQNPITFSSKRRYALGYRTNQGMNQGVVVGRIGVDRWDGKQWDRVGNVNSYAQARQMATADAEHRGMAIEAERQIELEGFDVVFVDYCEDSRTPGLLGQIRGVTDWELRQVKISRRANPTAAMLREILEHELRHVQDPSWDCGNRDVLGRGGHANA